MKLKLLGLITIMMVIMTCSSCNKEPVITFTTTSTVTHYQLSSPRQYDEAEDIWVYHDSGSVSISVPIISTYPDTLPTIFDQQVNVLPLKVTGNANISGSTLILNYHELDLVNTANNHDVVNATYIEM